MLPFQFPFRPPSEQAQQGQQQGQRSRTFVNRGRNREPSTSSSEPLESTGSLLGFDQSVPLSQIPQDWIRANEKHVQKVASFLEGIGFFEDLTTKCYEAVCEYQKAQQAQAQQQDDWPPLDVVAGTPKAAKIDPSTVAGPSGYKPSRKVDLSDVAVDEDEMCRQLVQKAQVSEDAEIYDAMHDMRVQHAMSRLYGRRVPQKEDYSDDSD